MGGLKAYDLFAITVVIMISGHFCYYFLDENMSLRIPDRILVAVFLVTVGYNTGTPPSRFLWIGAFIMTATYWVFYRMVFVDILGVIVLIRLTLEPFMERILRNKENFWRVNIILLLLYPLTNIFFEYGTLALIMAMAGWLNRNRSEIPPGFPKPYQYFIFTYLAFLAGTEISFHFTIWQFAIFAAGSAVTMTVLYNFRRLLVNGIKAPPRDIIEKICSFLGHKSLEIYVIHSILFQAAKVYLTIM
jgi:hypothetical protein